MEILTEAPKTSSFMPLVEHQSATPASFYSGPPVLHYHSDRCKIIVLESELPNSPALANLVSKAPVSTTNGSHRTNGDSYTDEDQPDTQKTIEDIDIWVTSDKLLLYSTTLQTGISIPYPTISLHAIQTLPYPSSSSPSNQALYMQLTSLPTPSSNAEDEDQEQDSISLTIIPTFSSPPSSTTTSSTPPPEQESPSQSLFNALSTCSNLHPDPTEDDEEMGVSMGMGPGSSQNQALEGSTLYASGLIMPGAQNNALPPPMPGSGGWITAENMNEFFDEEGNWIGGDDEDEEMQDGEGDNEGRGGLGPGAGTVRSRSGNEDGDGGGDEAEGMDELKWRRTE